MNADSWIARDGEPSRRSPHTGQPIVTVAYTVAQARARLAELDRRHGRTS
jgi:hypothetical protein